MISLYDTTSGAPLGQISPEALRFLEANLEEENADDHDYYINEATVDMLVERGIPADLLAVLRNALAGREEMEIRHDGPVLE